ncbi:MAG: membrane protein [Sulfuricaulis sp.]
MNLPMTPDDNSRPIDLQSLKNIAIAVYALQAVSFFLGVTFFIAIILDYVKLDDARGTWLESHFRWQIRTFWFGLLWFALGGLTFFIGIGWFILFAAALWLIYRILKGWLKLNDNKPIPV